MNISNWQDIGLALTMLIILLSYTLSVYKEYLKNKKSPAQINADNVYKEITNKLLEENKTLLRQCVESYGLLTNAIENLSKNQQQMAVIITDFSSSVIGVECDVKDVKDAVARHSDAINNVRLEIARMNKGE
jgi:hypothetical protein